MRNKILFECIHLFILLYPSVPSFQLNKNMIFISYMYLDIIYWAGENIKRPGHGNGNAAEYFIADFFFFFLIFDFRWVVHFPSLPSSSSSSRSIYLFYIFEIFYLFGSRFTGKYSLLLLPKCCECQLP